MRGALPVRQHRAGGVFSVDAAGSLRCHPAAGLAAAEISAMQHRIRARVLRPSVRQGEMRLIAFLIEPASIRTILVHLGEPTTQPVLDLRVRLLKETGLLDVLSIAIRFVLA